MNNRFEALRVFCSLAETLQFKKTAHQLALSPPVVSRVIAELEDYQKLSEVLYDIAALDNKFRDLCIHYKEE